MDARYKNFGLYNIEIDYLRYLHSIDSEVHFDEDRHYERKPFVGIIIFVNEYNYFIPLTSGKPKHLDWDNVSKTHYLIYEVVEEAELEDGDVYKPIGDGKFKKILAALDMKKMVPVPDGLYSKIDINHMDDIRYKTLLVKEALFCRRIQEAILTKSLNLYQKQINTGIIRRYCCNFKLLESACNERQY